MQEKKRPALGFRIAEAVAVFLLTLFALPSYIQAAQPQVASGERHTVGLRSDGTVVAVGWNYFGQLNVESWMGITQIVAGGHHTVGLKSDGTVVAVGLNGSGQLNVSSWTDIIQVAAGQGHTVGLKSDGTVVAVGNNVKGQLNVSTWTDIIQVAAGDDHTVGLKSDGTVVAVGNSAYGTLNVSPWTDIIQVAAGDQRTLGLKSDGTVVAAGWHASDTLNVDSWTGITQVASGYLHTVGLKSDGTVVALGYNRHGELNVGSWTEITQVATFYCQTVGLKSDGTVVAVGYNGYGQLNVSNWDLDGVSYVPDPGIISGTITDTSGNGISDIVVRLTAPDGSAHEAKTGATGFFAFDITGIPQPRTGIYTISPVVTEAHPSFYPSYEIDGEVRCYRQVELMDTAQGIADVDFTTNPKIPFVKLLFPRSGDRLKGDFAFFGTAFKTLDPGNCTGHDDIKALEVLVDGIPRFKASLFGRDSDRFSLSQITWLDMAGNVVTAPWESMSSLIADGEYASIQIKAVNTSDKVGYSERIAIKRASTANSAVMEGCELPFPASNEARTLTNASDGSESQTWFIFNWDCYSFDTCQAEAGKKCVEDPTLPKPQRVEYDERLTSGEKSIHQVYPVEDVYPVGLAAMDAEGNTLVSVKKVIAYKAARFGDPEANNSGSMSAAFGANVVSGNFYYQTTDMSLEGVGLPFVLWRRYNSFGHGGESIFGKGGWNHAYSHKIMLGKSGRRLYLVMPDGHWERFAFVDGMWRTMTPGAFWMVWQTAGDAFSAWDRNSTRYDFSYIVDVWKVTAITDINGNKLALSYGTSESDKGKLLSIVDTRGRTISFTYGASGYCEEVSDGTGRSVAYEYDEEGRLESFTDRQSHAEGLGSKWVYEYETFGSADLLARIIDPRGNAAPPEGRYAILENDYDESLRVVSQKDALGNIWHIAYNSPSGKTTVTDPTGREIVFAIDSATQMVTGVKNGSTNEALTEYKGNIQRDKVQEASLVGRSVQPEGNDEALSYSEEGTGNPTSITRSGKITTGLGWEEQRFDESLGRVNKNLLKTMTVQGVASPYQMGYGDDKKNLRSITDPLEGVATFDYNSRGQVTETTDPRGHKTKRTYDASGYLELVSDTFTNGRGDTVTYTAIYTYDDKKRVHTVTDRNGETTTFDYDENDRITKITDPDAKAITYSYDESGNLKTLTNRRGSTTFFEYNKANLLEKKKLTVQGEIYETTYGYDGLQRLFRLTNARSYGGERTFDGAGRIKQVKDPLNQYQELTYDGNGNLTAIEVHDSDGALVQRTERTYDDLNRLKVSRAKLDQEYLETVYEYYDGEGETGWLKSVTDPKGNKTSFKYDALGRVALVEDAKGNTASAEYDKNGNLIKVTDPEGHETAYGYDALNRMIWKKDHASEHTWEYDYDGNGNLVYYKSPDGKIISYEYYTQNRLKKITYFDGIELGRYTSYTYDENANVKTMTDFSGVASLVTSYDYDELNRVKLIQDGFGQSVGYGYDGVSNITEIIYPGEKKVEYGYDKADRMETVTDWLGHVTTYSYNALDQIKSIVHGNKTKATMDYDSSGRLYYYANNKSNGEIISSYLFTLEKNGNRKTSGMVEPLPPVLSAGSEAYGIDALNRISSGPHGTFSYDAKGNLIGETRGSETITYGYDFEDMLTSWSNGPDKDSYIYKYSGSKNLVAVVKNGTELRHVLDLNRPLPEIIARTDTQGKVKDYFVYGASGLISRITPDGSSHTYHFDPMGNTIAMTDEAQQMVNRYSYNPYGKARKLERVENPFQYVGQYSVMAQDNGLSFMRARFYHPDIRRFVSQDKVWGSVKEPQSLNLYSYVQGNPITRMDPSGLYGVDVHHDLTYKLALHAGFTPSAAEIIAAADQSVDTAAETDPVSSSAEIELTDLTTGENTSARMNYHFPRMPGKRVERNSAIARFIIKKGMESLDPRKFGQALHTYQDSWSHEGFTDDHVDQFESVDSTSRDGHWKKGGRDYEMAFYTYRMLIGFRARIAEKYRDKWLMHSALGWDVISASVEETLRQGPRKDTYEEASTSWNLIKNFEARAAGTFGAIKNLRREFKSFFRKRDD